LPKGDVRSADGGRTGCGAVARADSFSIENGTLELSLENFQLSESAATHPGQMHVRRPAWDGICRERWTSYVERDGIVPYSDARPISSAAQDPTSARRAGGGSAEGYTTAPAALI
jgi:hypothetical protein